MKVVVLILKVLEAAILVALFNYITILGFIYLREWEIDLLEYKNELEKNEFEQRSKKRIKIISLFCEIYSKFINLYEWIFRHLDPLNLFSVLDEEE